MSELQIGDRVQTGMILVKMSELQIGDRVQTGKKSVKMSELQIGNRVQTGKKSVKMSELQIRDRVRTGETFSLISYLFVLATFECFFNSFKCIISTFFIYVSNKKIKILLQTLEAFSQLLKYPTSNYAVSLQLDTIDLSSVFIHN